MAASAVNEGVGKATCPRLLSCPSFPIHLQVGRKMDAAQALGPGTKITRAQCASCSSISSKGKTPHALNRSMSIF